MEPKKKPGLVRVLILALSALTMVLTGLAVATTASATPEAKSPCPDNFIESDDGKSCYQHAQSQTTTTPATCKTGHVTPNGKSCWLPAVVTPQTRTETVAATSTPQAPTYTCPAGFTSSGGGAGKTCSKQVTTQTSVGPNVSPNAPIYSCPAGSTASGGSGASLTCTRSQTNQTSVAASVSPNAPIYSCPAGSTVAGGSGSSLTCQRTETRQTSVGPNVSQNDPIYSCPAGSQQSGSGSSISCTTSRTVVSEIAATEVPGAITYSCSQGTLSGQTCTITTNTPRTVTDPCPSGTIEVAVAAGSRCKPNNGSFVTLPACGATQENIGGHADGTVKCVNTTAKPTRTVIDTSQSTVAATPSQAPSTYTCPASHPTAKAGNMCSNFSTVTDPAAPNVQQVAPTVTCPAGTTTNGAALGAKQCIGSENVQVATNVVTTPVAPTVTCPSGTVSDGAAPGTKQCLGSTTVQVPVAANSQQVAPTVTCPAGTTTNGAAVGAKQCLGSATNTQTAAVIVTQNPAVVSCAAGYSGPTNGQCSRTVAAADSITCKNGSSPMAVGKDHVCIIGAADVSSKTVPVCAKGELSKDKTKCVIALSSSSSVAPAFTG